MSYTTTQRHEHQIHNLADGDFRENSAFIWCRLRNFQQSNTSACLVLSVALHPISLLSALAKGDVPASGVDFQHCRQYQGKSFADYS
jgi:hypothetical protein